MATRDNNNGMRDISSVYVGVYSPLGRREWGRNLLGEFVLVHLGSCCRDGGNSNYPTSSTKQKRSSWLVYRQYDPQSPSHCPIPLTAL